MNKDNDNFGNIKARAADKQDFIKDSGAIRDDGHGNTELHEQSVHDCIQEDIEAIPSDHEAQDRAISKFDLRHEQTNQIPIDSEFKEFVKDPEEVLKQEAPSVFTAKTMNECIEDAKKTPIPNKLFGDLWFEGEVCLLFSDTDYGKSALAVQIAEGIAAGTPILHFENKIKSKSVAYVDIELSDKQVEARYSDNFQDHYIFSNKLMRLQIDRDNINEEISLEDQILHGIEQYSKEVDIKIFIIDNNTAIISDPEKGRNAIRLMKELNNLKKSLGLSILVLAHTPKRDPRKPLRIDDLAGSKHLANLCDSMFAIGKSIKDESQRYIKQLKTKPIETKYGSTNVILCHLQKSSDNMLRFEFDGFGREANLLKSTDDDEKEVRAEKIVKLIEEKNMKYEDIGQELGMSKGNVSKIYRKYKSNNSSPLVVVSNGNRKQEDIS